MEWVLLLLFAADALAGAGLVDEALLCPEGRTEWLARREEFAAELTKGGSRSGLIADWETCFESDTRAFQNDPELTKCFEPLREVLVSAIKAEKASFAKTSPTAQAKAAKAYTSVPKELQDPAFLEMLDKGDTNAADAYLETENKKRRDQGLQPYLYIRFEGLAPPLNSSEGQLRYMVYDQGNPAKKPNTEKFINFTIPSQKQGAPSGAKQLSVVATHTDREGNAKSFFSDHQRISKKGVLSVEHAFDRQSALGTFNCIDCHSSGGPLPIRSSAPVESKYRAARETINRRISSFGNTLSEQSPTATTHAGFTIDPTHLPSKVIRECFSLESRQTVSKQSVENLREAMNCNQCHDGEMRGKISSRSTITKHWILSGAMPPGLILTKEEREALANCITGNRRELAFESLRHSPCNAGTAPRQKQEKLSH